MTRITDREIERQTYLATKKLAFSAALKAGSMELPPLQAGESRMIFSRERYLDFIRSGEFAELLDEAHEVVTQMTLDDEFAVTVFAKQDATAASAGMRSRPL
jgi:hypothetical protein